ncbi:potassium transporter Kup [Austwickia sp. TVS 96-490-7B]|uniref:potassium transporter Kup n=1 Tax=Austwickia sp. TVS 96-490-7B TaxID=2830843 RepID=UPI00210580C3|nr:potassium transporter Kup [Austwickia sp. TVS 96-490-7B]
MNSDSSGAEHPPRHVDVDPVAEAFIESSSNAPGCDVVQPTESSPLLPNETAAMTPPPTSTDQGRQKLPFLTLAALGIVFGDIGTSPLYSLQTVFSIDQHAVAPTPQNVYGVISLVFWSITTIVSVKYVALVMRAHNQGEGGILALTALLRDSLRTARGVQAVTVLGIVGAALFYGDSVITPAISVMSAVEGLNVANPALEDYILPISVTILTVLFLVQRFGTAVVGRAFGPVMVLWFGTIAALGVPPVLAHPQIIGALSPTHAVVFAAEEPMIGFIAMGAVVLTITGAEALYADMGHFGAKPIRLAWFFVVLPCLIVNYLGQGAEILADPKAIDNPFFRLAPSWATVPLVVLATVATVIASQAVISGAFSVSHQAVHMGLMPRLSVRHTSKEEGGQIYVPTVNWLLYFGVLLLIAGFPDSSHLANAYGLAVTGTLILTTVLFLGLADKVWGWPIWVLVVIAVLVGGLEAVFFSANLTKVLHGGWLPVLIAGTLIFVMTTWMRGAILVRRRRAELEGPLRPWIETVRSLDIPRVPGTAVFLHANPDTVPLALKENLRFNHVLHEQIAIVTVVVQNIPHVRHVDRVTFDDLGYTDDGICHVQIRLGFNDSQNVPVGLSWGAGKSEEFHIDPDEARYFLSLLKIHATEGSGLTRWRHKIFVWLTHNEGDRTVAFHLPPSRTAVMGGSLSI